ncbi:MAG: hypothetical protein HZB54_07480 [Deltaproteobacteria bacterium]|nr:hypothetical protein [Deltaproteobacteria bacterium]
MLLGILIILILNGVISFAYTLMNGAEATTLWAMLAVNFVFYLGMTQTGIIFSAIMRIAKSEWGRYFSKFGVILTLSFIPVAFITFLIIYIGGTENLFYWASPSPLHGHDAGHVSPWLGKGLFLWRTVITMAVFYIMSYIYFRTSRIEENGERVSYDIEKRLNLMAGFVMVFYIIANTNVAWDFGMMIIPHWESTIFPAYFWVGNVFGGTAFLFLMARLFLSGGGKGIGKEHLDSMGKVLLGFTLLWIYMFWSQHIVIWYSDLPNLTGPLFKQMRGNYTGIFSIMILALFILPFFMLIFRRIKLSLSGLSITACIICIGTWTTRYLMILPVFKNGGEPVLTTWTGVSLTLAGLAATLLSVLLFLRLFPKTTTIQK